MNRKTRVFISYKTGADSGLTFQANSIRQHLEASHYDVWMDTANLAAGIDWNKQIYSQIPDSDILLLLLAKETAASDWVRREIDVAKGAKVTILPVLIRGDFDKQEALDRFDIPRLQFASLLTGEESEFQKLIEAIENLKARTGEGQVSWLEKLREGEKVARFDPPDRNVVAYRMGAQEVHLAGGDMAAMKNIDVFVNSENGYMQMARIFEAKTISSILRYRASHIDEAQRLVEDTLQDELDLQVQALFGTRPVGKNTVIATSAGHPGSQLRTVNNARFVLHTATVSVEGDGQTKRLAPIQDDSGMKDAVKNTLEKVLYIDEKKGVISPEGTEQRKEQEAARQNYVPIESIIFPVFGTGHGGRPVYEVAPLMIRAIKEFLLDHRDDLQFKLKDIYVCVFSEEDVREVKEVLRMELGGNDTPPVTGGS